MAIKHSKQGEILWRFNGLEIHLERLLGRQLLLLMGVAQHILREKLFPQQWAIGQEHMILKEEPHQLRTIRMVGRISINC